MEAVEREVVSVWVGLLRDVQRATETAANRLGALVEEDIATDMPAVRSSWGRKALRLGPLGLEDGMTTKEVSRQIGQNDDPNTQAVLEGLQKQGLVETVPGATPRRWRLTQNQRRDRILRASRAIPTGRWVTYGDVAIAAFDNRNLARVIARVAARNPAFANPHRVLAKGGRIAEGWRDDEGRGPEECERRLREIDKIEVTDGVADPNKRMGYEELKARLDAEDEVEDEA
jgi:O6-methylguanine-DNA--protein-cysteine methyltransferase